LCILFNIIYLRIINTQTHTHTSGATFLEMSNGAKIDEDDAMAAGTESPGGGHENDQEQQPHDTEHQIQHKEEKDERSQGRPSSENDEDHVETEDNNFDEEYDKLRDNSSGGLRLLDELRKSLDGQVHGLFTADKTLEELFEQKEDLRAIRSEVTRVKKMLHGADKFLTDDLAGSLAALRKSLSTYSAAVFDKLRQEYNNGQHHEDDSRKDDDEDANKKRHVTEAHQTFARISIQLKELEQFAAQIEESVHKMAAFDGSSAVIAEADQADHRLDHAAQTRTEQETAEEKEMREKMEQDMKMEQERRAREALEEQQRLEEEERCRKEELEARRLEEEERLRKEDPRHWPASVYLMSADDDLLGSSVACVVRAPPDTVSFDREQLDCSAVSWRDNRYIVAENDEIVSNMLCLKPANGSNLQFDSAVWIAIPYAATSRGREVIIRLQEVRGKPAASVSSAAEQQDNAEKADTETEDKQEMAKVPDSPVPAAEWQDVLTRDTTVEGQETIRFVETPIKQIDSNGINIIVLTRPKRDTDKWNNKGGRLVSSVDPRVSISAPKNAFRLSTDVTLQVITLDSSAMVGLKERYDGCEQLLGTSPLLSLAMSSKPQKPLVVTVANPPGGGRKQKATGESPGKGGATLPRAGTGQLGAGFGNSLDQGDTEDMIQLLVKDTGGKWRHRDNIKLEQQRDCVVFQLNEIVHRLILLRTMPDVDSTNLCRMATSLESSLQERPAQLVVRQSARDATLVFIECCRRDAVDKLLSGRLKAAKFTDGPEPSRLFVLREGDLVEISFRDNIDTIDKSDEPLRFVFNSNLSTINLQLTVNEVNVFAQNALDVYRGYVRLSLVERPYQPPPKLAGASTTPAQNVGTVGGGKKPVAGSGTKAGTTVTAIDRHLVCEVMLTLPKPAKEVTHIKRVDVPITGPDPLSGEYFDHLASDLGEDWTRLAERLKISRPAVQRISRAHAHLDNSVQCARLSAREMLAQWFRSSAKSNNKVEELRQALVEAGRNDLAEELYHKHKEFRQHLDKKNAEIRLQKSIRVFLDNLTAARSWRKVGKGLGLSLEALEAIGGPAVMERPGPAAKKNVISAKQARDEAQQMLSKWQETAGENASVDYLLTVVKKLKLNDVAASISVI
jgi:hypothetical protein